MLCLLSPNDIWEDIITRCPQHLLLQHLSDLKTINHNQADYCAMKRKIEDLIHSSVFRYHCLIICSWAEGHSLIPHNTYHTAAGWDGEEKHGGVKKLQITKYKDGSVIHFSSRLSNFTLKGQLGESLYALCLILCIFSHPSANGFILWSFPVSTVS